MERMSGGDNCEAVNVSMSPSQLVDSVQLSVVDLQAAQEMGEGDVRQIIVQAGQGMDDRDEDSEPSAKRQKIQDVNNSFMKEMSVKQILFNINKAICLRLDGIEHKIENACARLRDVEDKLETFLTTARQNGSTVFLNNSQKKGTPPYSRRNSAVIVGLPQERFSTPAPGQDNSFQNLGPNVTLITLNTEDDYPNGCWLGDDTNPEMRVRVPITQSDLLHIHSNCRTAEKMALTLLDYLFDRETQANSNVSGLGKHGKKQLDPLMIYGIRCHLIHRFAITENDWHRIKQNIDSKCRTAFRRKQKGMPLTVKGFRGKAATMVDGMANDTLSDEDSFQDGDLRIAHGGVDLQHAVTMQTPGLSGGEIQILHATPEQISQLQHAQHIQILQGDGVIQQIQGGESGGNMHVAVSLPNETIQVAQVTTETGEVLQIHQQSGEGVDDETLAQ
ncbi:protein BANP-like isoform X2 [Liolophura sinensis]|uniref:protein BANP-like isoform X2 n=1 Tax=Liolophura sinensis TaxID=3198878 RepID=UPI003158C747